MYNGYTESEEKVEARKRRILGTATPPETAPTEGKPTVQEIKPMGWLKRQILIMVILYPAMFFLGSLIGKLIQALGR